MDEPLDASDPGDQLVSCSQIEWAFVAPRLASGEARRGSIAAVLCDRGATKPEAKCDAECAAKLKKRTLTNLYNQRPAWLGRAHKKLDAAVAAAYGWSDFVEILEDTGPGEIYDFDEGGWLILDTDEKGYIAEMEKFRKESDERILERLLALNLERAAEEEKAAKVKKPKTSRAKKEDELI